MRLTVDSLAQGDGGSWDAFVCGHPGASVYHLSGWRRVIEGAYGHRAHFLIASRGEAPGGPDGAGSVAGVLPLVHMKHRLFGNRLVSLPFFDLGGVLARDEEAERALVSQAVRLAARLGADSIELRHAQEHGAPAAAGPREPAGPGSGAGHWSASTRTHKVRMILGLPATADELMQSFRPKLRSQIRRPQKEGVRVEIGGEAFLDDFYRVFTVNMRDLGSPVHSKRLLALVLEVFGARARILLCRKEQVPVACAMVLAFGNTLYNPWASSLREYRRLSPNMLLYWGMLEHAVESGLSRFDFGRCTPGEGTYRFKKQWGAAPEPLHWQFLVSGVRGEGEAGGGVAENPVMRRAGRCWQRLPVPVTRVLGPMIRKHIDL